MAVWVQAEQVDGLTGLRVGCGTVDAIKGQGGKRITSNEVILGWLGKEKRN